MSMDVPTIVAHVLTVNTDTFVHPALQGLSDADLLKRPSDQCNPMGWLLWHQTRVEDVILSHISGMPQAWVAGTWHEQFGMPAEPHQTPGRTFPRAGDGAPAHHCNAARLCRSRARKNTDDLAYPDASRPGARAPLPGRWHQNSRGFLAFC